MKKIKYFLIISLLLLSIIKVNASDELILKDEDSLSIELTEDNSIYDIDLVDRNTLDNYGVNKKWEINDNNKKNVLNTNYVDASLKVYDYAEILTEEEETILRKNMYNFIDKTKMDVVILTIKEPYSVDSRNEEIAADFYDYNDFGINFDKYSGILLLRNTYSVDPYFDIYTFGEAQRYYDYDRLQVILDGIYSDLHYGNYLNGFNTFISLLNMYYSDGIADYMENTYVDDMGYIHRKFVPNYIVCAIAGLLVTIIIVCIYISKNKMIKKEIYADEYLDKSSIDMFANKDVLISSYTTHYVVSSSSSGSSGGSYGGGHHSSFSSHSGSSGGGHSSGGGRHG